PAVSAQLAIVPPAGSLLSNLTISPNSVTGASRAAMVTVDLDAPAQIVPFVVAIASSSAAAPVPATVSFMPGSRTATFTIAAGAVAAKTTATITATAGGISKTATLDIVPPLTIAPAVLTGGQKATATLSIDGLAPTTGTHV